MITNALYRLYGLIIRIPAVGPWLDRWLRARRGWVYRVRDLALRLERRLSGPGAAHTSNVHHTLQDLGWMIEGLRQGLADVQRRQLQWQTGGAAEWQARLDQHQHALNLKVDAALEALTQRVERAERQLGQARVQANAAAPQPRILNPGKLAAHSTRPQGVWLEVGCGPHPDPDRINIDLRALPGVDIVAGADGLPLADTSVSDLRAAHLVEHFTAQHFVDRILPEWWRVLAPGGVLRLITPDLQAMLAAHQRGELSETDLVHVLYGGQDYEGDFHYHAYSTQSLSHLLAAFGFTDIHTVAAGRRNGLCFEFELTARKPQA